MTQGQSQVKLFSIDKFAQICRTTPRTLRFWEKQGLFKPAKISRSNGYRFYDLLQSRDFLRIKLLQSFHIKLSNLKKAKQTKNLQQILIQQTQNLEEEIKEKQYELNFLKSIDYLLLQDTDFKQLLEYKTYGPYTLFCHQIENAEYAKITDYINELREVARQNNIDTEPEEITFYLDHLYKPKNTKLEIALICKNKPTLQNLPKEHYFKEFKKTNVAFFKYIGLYDYLPLVYKKFYDFMDDEGINYNKNYVFEKYIRGSLNEKSQYNYLTEIGYPVTL